MKVIVGSLNAVKIAAVKEAFSKFFASVEVIGMSVDSMVCELPATKVAGVLVFV